MHPREIREELKRQFPIDSEFDAFVQDYFLSVFRLYSCAMNREDKINLLMLKEEYPAILTAMRLSLSGNVKHQIMQATASQMPSLASHADLERARLWIVQVSLGIVAIYVTFFAVSPFIGFPLETHHATRMIQLLFPVFFGYIGSAYRRLVRRQSLSFVKSESNLSLSMLRLLVRGPIFVFITISISGLAVYLFSNRINALPGEGMTTDQLFLLFSVALCVLTVSTNFIISYLFDMES